MSIRIRKAADRGHARYDWLDTWHTFSFDTYYDPAHMGFRSLRVINEDRVQPGQGFGMHGHQDMEIITYVLEGALEHRDSMGTGSIIHAGEFQRMSAGTGVLHSEFNPSPTEPVHSLPDLAAALPKGPAAELRAAGVLRGRKQARFRLVASPDGSESLTIHQDAEIFLCSLDAGQQATHELQEGRHAWLQVLRGAVEVNGQKLLVSDGAALSDEPGVTVQAKAPSELMLFDLA